jgi:hypothetical protein
MDAERTASFPQPIFVGGSARSGTHAVGRILSAPARYHLIETEARFHSSAGGLCHLLEGRTELDAFVDHCLGKWWRHGVRQRRGLNVIIDRAPLKRALERFRERFPEEPWEAGRQLVHDVLDPAAERAGKSAWIDVSGQNIKSAPTLHRLFPSARFIHMVRDGRAVTAAILHKRGMTDDRRQAFAHWVARVRRSHAGLSQLPDGVVLTIMLDDLAAHDREGAFTRLTRFLELDQDGPAREYFDQAISPERAHVGAWRERMAPADARWVDRRYRRVVRRLHRKGITWIPDPR